MNRVIVITGSTRGIGLGLTRAFLEKQCNVVISGRYADVVASTVEDLTALYDPATILGVVCDVTDEDQVRNLWVQTIQHYGKVDIWINNAGKAHMLKNTWEISKEEIRQIVETNILGTINGSRIAIQGMLKQQFGAIYNMEGFGSTGSKMKGLAIYGMTKYALNYFNKSLIRETLEYNLLVGIIRPGMVATDLVRSQYTGLDEEFARDKPILNILSQRVETVAPIVVEAILKNKKTGKIIHGSSTASLLHRFITSPFVKRDVFS